MEVGFGYGAMCESLEDQALKQGLTLGEHGDRLEKLRMARIALLLSGLITDSEAERVAKKLHRMVMERIKKLPDEDK